MAINELRPQLQRLHDQAEQLRTVAESKLSGLTDEQLSWSPSKDRWSIGEILDHVIRSISMTMPRFEHALDKAGPAGAEQVEEIRYSLFERQFVRAVSPDAPFKTPVPRMFRPEKPSQPKQTVSRFLEVQGELLSLIERADERRLQPVRVVSPVSSLVRGHFLPYLDGIVQHERYHWGQVEALLAETEFPR